MRCRILQTRAVDDLNDIHGYLSDKQSVPQADLVLSAIDQAITHLCEFPFSGALFPARNRQLEGIRFWTVRDYPRYVVYYLFNDEVLKVLRVVHGSMKISKLLRDLN